MLTGKLISKLYKKYAILFILGISATLLCDWVQLYLPQYLGKVVDLVNAWGKDPTTDLSAMSTYLWIIIVIGLALFVGRMGWRFALFGASQRIEADIRREMYQKAEALSVSYYHSNKIGNIMSWFTTDLETIEEFTGFGTLMLADAVFLTVFALVYMFNCDWLLSLVCLVPVALIAVWGFLVEKVMAKKWEARQSAYDSVYDYSQESFSGIRVIKAFVKENQQIIAFSKRARNSQDTNVNFAKVSVQFDVMIESIIAIIMTLIMSLGGYMVFKVLLNPPAIPVVHRINTIGDLVSFTGYFDTIIWPMIALGQVVSMRSRAKASLGRVTNFLDTPVEIKDREDAIAIEKFEGKIEFRNFSFKYPDSDVDYLKNISLTINPGETIGVVGKVGSGKSTLVNVLLHLFNVNDGQVFVDDVDIMNIKIKNLRDNIGYVPQDNFLFSNTLANNISFSSEEVDMELVQQAAQFSDVDENIRAFPKQYETISGERGQTLSGGQKQRVSIARAFFKNAPIMIMDDSVSAVDVKTEETILRNIEEKRAGKTTILIASRVSTVSKLNRIIVLNNGELEAFDTPENLLKISPTYQRMVALQELEKEKGGNN